MPHRIPDSEVEKLVGRRYEKLSVVSWYNGGKGNRKMLLCRCDCGKEVRIRPVEFKKGSCKQCWHCRKYYLVGQRFGKLVVMGSAGYIGKNKRCLWLCQCDCGGTKKVETSHLTAGRITHCGCYLKSAEYRKKKGDHLRLPEGVAIRNRVIGDYKNNAKIHNRVFDLTYDQAIELLTSDCHYCGKPPSTTQSKNSGAFAHNGIDRLDNDKGYTLDNVVSCCPECNYKKGDQHVDDFLKWIRTVAEHRELCK
jgi:hypothetical protein